MTGEVFLFSCADDCYCRQKHRSWEDAGRPDNTFEEVQQHVRPHGRNSFWGIMLDNKMSVSEQIFQLADKAAMASQPQHLSYKSFLYISSLLIHNFRMRYLFNTLISRFWLLIKTPAFTTNY